MNTFKLETSMPFSLTRITTEVEHTEVKKPSGISYILLVLINETKDKNINLSNLLTQFGVSEDLHPIFANEIQELIHDLNILECVNYKYEKKNFKEYLISNFKFTQKGKKVFKEELIPSKNNVTDKEEYWFDPARNRLMTKIPSDWRVGYITKSELPNKFAEQFPYNDIVELEIFLDSEKGKGICVKEEEVITGLKILKQDYFFTTFPIAIEINRLDNSIAFTFEEKKLSQFFDNHYKSPVKANCLAVKNKFKFKSVVHQINDISSIDIAGIHYPVKYEQFLKKEYAIVVTRGNYSSNQTTNNFESPKAVGNLSDYYESIHYDTKRVFCLAPVEITFFDIANDSELELPFLLEINLSKEESENTLKKLVEEFNEYNTDNIKNIFNVYSYLSDYKSLENKYNDYFNNDIEHNISILKSIKDLVNINVIKNWFTKKTNQFYEEYYDVISLDAIDYQLAFGGWMIKSLNIPDAVLIQKSIDSNEEVDTVEIFDTLLDAGFELDTLLKKLNLYPIIFSYIMGHRKVESRTKFFIKIDTIKNLFNKLIDLTGIDKVDNFIIKEDINKKEFIEAFSGITTKLNEIHYPKKINSKEYKEFQEYLSNFKYLDKLFKEEISATNKPETLSEKQLTKMIKSNNYFKAVIHLAVKLEWILREKYKLKGKLYKMIDSMSDEILTKKEKDLLHALRQERNNLVHPTKDHEELSTEDLDSIVKIIFHEEE